MVLFIVFISRYIEGKPKTSVRIAYKYTKRLYVIRGRKYVRVACVRLTDRCLKGEWGWSDVNNFKIVNTYSVSELATGMKVNLSQ